MHHSLLLWILAAGNLIVLAVTVALTAITSRSLKKMTDNTAATAAAVAQIKADVAAERSAVESARALLTQLAQLLRAAIESASNAGATDEQLAELSALHAEITGQSGDLAAAVTANTPNPPPPPPPPRSFDLEPKSLDAMIVGQAFDDQMAPTGGIPPWAFSIGAGALPDGLSLSAGGQISGTPTTVGDYDVTIQAHDANNTQGEVHLTGSVLTNAAPEPAPADPTSDGAGAGGDGSGPAGDGSSGAAPDAPTGAGAQTGDGAGSQNQNGADGAGSQE